MENDRQRREPNRLQKRRGNGVSLHCARWVWDESQVDLAAPLAGRVRRTAHRSHGRQYRRPNETDEVAVTKKRPARAHCGFETKFHVRICSWHPNRLPIQSCPALDPLDTDGDWPMSFLSPSCHVVVAQSVNRRSEEHTSELQSRRNLVCRLLLEKKNKSSQHPTLKQI